MNSCPEKAPGTITRSERRMNEEQYRKAVKKFKKKWFGTDRNERLKGYIDEKLAEVKSDMYKMIGVDSK